MLIKPLNKSGTLYSSWNMVQLTIRSFSTCNLDLNSNSMINTCWRASLTFFVLALVKVLQIFLKVPYPYSLPCPHQILPWNVSDLALRYWPRWFRKHMEAANLFSFEKVAASVLHLMLPWVGGCHRLRRSVGVFVSYLRSSCNCPFMQELHTSRDSYCSWLIHIPPELVISIIPNAP